MSLSTHSLSPERAHGQAEIRGEIPFKRSQVAGAVDSIFQFKQTSHIPKEGETMSDLARALGVAESSLKNNLFILPRGCLVQFDGKYVTVVHEGERPTSFPAANDGRYALAA